MSGQTHHSGIPTAHRYPSLDNDLAVRYVQPVFSSRQGVARHSFPTSSKICGRLQPSRVATTFELLTPKKEDKGVQLADAGCLATSGFCQRPAIEDHAEIPATDGTVAPLIPSNPVTLAVPLESGEDGDKTEPSNARDGISQKLEPTTLPAHAPVAPNFATAGAAAPPSTPTLPFNPHLEAPASEDAPSPHQSISVTPLSRDALYPATTTRTMDTPLWRVKARKVLEYLTTKHPKVVAAFSTVLVAVGNIASHPGVSACVGGPILAIVQSVGAIAVAVGKRLRNALDSAAAPAPAQTHRQAVGGPSRMSMVAYEVEEYHII